jgi:hypothetical protein
VDKKKKTVAACQAAGRHDMPFVERGSRLTPWAFRKSSRE